MDLRPTSNAAAAFKDLQPSGLSNGGPLAALLLSHPAAAGRLCSFVAWIRLRSPQALAIDPPLLSAPLPIYEMDSNSDKGWIERQVAGSQRSGVG